MRNKGTAQTMRTMEDKNIASQKGEVERTKILDKPKESLTFSHLRMGVLML